MKIWLFACLFGAGLLPLFLPLVLAGDADLVPIERLLDELKAAQTASSMAPLEEDRCRLLPKKVSLDQVLLFSPQELKLSATACGDGVRVETACEEIKKDCFNSLGANYGCYAFPAAVKERFDSPELRRRVFRHAASAFNKFTQDPEMQRLCCGDNRKCTEEFAATPLFVLKGLPADDMTAIYQLAHGTTGPSVKVSEGTLLQARTPQAIEFKLLHELGHACQDARRAINWSKEDLARGYATTCGELDITEGDLRDLFGRKVARCAMESLVKTAPTVRGACVGAWAQEAFADAVFLSRFSDPGFYAWMCVASGDPKHAPPSSYLPCFMDLPQVRKGLCP